MAAVQLKRRSLPQSYPRGIKHYRNGYLTKFFSYAVMAMFFKELFTPTLNRIAVSAQYVSSTLNDQLRHMQINETIRKTETVKLFSKRNINMMIQS